MANSSDPGRRKITGSRRRIERPSSDSSPRTDAPRRWSSTGSGSSSSSQGSGSGLASGLGALGGLLSSLGSGSSSGSGGTGTGLPVKKGCLSGKGGCGLIGIIAVIILVVVIIFSLQQCGGCDIFNRNPETTPTNTQGATPHTNITTSPSTTYVPSGERHKWLVMLFQDADDSVLEKDIYIDLNEAEIAGSSDDVLVVAQIDRYNGGYSGDGNWTETKRFIVQQDNDLNRIRSQEVASLGELNMASGQTLVDFVSWAVQTYPSDRYALIMSDHGMGWPGGWTDAAPSAGGDPNIPLANAIGDMIYLHELDEALEQIRNQTGIDRLDLVGMDACLMAQMEVFSALSPHARYAVASEEVEPALGWAYAGFLKALQSNPNMTGAELAGEIVESYIDQDELISSSSQRQQLSRDITLTAVDLSRIAQLNNSLNQLVFSMQNASQQVIASARTYAQNYTSVFGSSAPPSFIDLGNLLQIIRQKSTDSTLNNSIDAVINAINQAVIAEKHGPQKQGSTGISIYFPNSQLYKNAVAGVESYTAIASRFALESLWDDFLAFHYTGRAFSLADTQVVVPPASSVNTPAAGNFSVSNLSVSSSQAGLDNPVVLSADIAGQNIGYIYLFAGYYDKQANSIFIADQDYIESPDTRLADGVYYPDWGEGEFTLEFSWEPIVFAINDGDNLVTALFKPESYGRTAAEAVYTVDGIYTFAQDNQQIYARLYFSNSKLQKVVAFSGSYENSAPHEITPAAGDQFTVTENWLDLDSSGRVIARATQQGGTVTFGNNTLGWESVDAAAGSYMVGFVVSDLDGEQQQSLAEINVS